MQAATMTGLSAQERERALSFLLDTREKLRESVAWFEDDADWDFRREEAGWSIAGIVEHVALIEQRACDIVCQMLGDPKEPLRMAPLEMDELIFTQIPIRSGKLQAPERVHPKGRWSGPEALNIFFEQREKTQMLLDTPGLRQRYFTHPLFGPWDGYQWIIGTAAHSARHAAQIWELRECEAFKNRE